MSEAIRRLKPIVVWNKFADLNAVPRPSKKEELVIQFMLDFGRQLKLETFKDHVGNVIIRKPATLGLEDRKVLTLQSHLDMVHQKNNDTVFDFETTGIQMLADGDWVRADGTTLGADNGMGVAAIMALLESVDIPHPPLEALFTIDEETGMTGAMGLEGGVLKGEILLNLDTEEDDELDIGCAGGVDVTATGTYLEESIPADYQGYALIVKGLSGGHSGMEIHKGLGNSNKIMNRLLFKSTVNHGLRIMMLNGGGLRNAIPRESRALVAIKNTKKTAFEAGLKNWTAVLQKEFESLDPKLSIQWEAIDTLSKVLSINAQEKLLKAIHEAHDGVYAMSADMTDLVETSNNVAKVEVKDGTIKISCLTRSSVSSGKIELANALKNTFEMGGLEVVFSGDYPGWKPNPDSAILKVLEKKYETLFKEKPRVVACHAGLECGILGTHYPEMDMISFGPTILGAHSPDERVQISSVQKFWSFLLEILKDAPKR